MFLRRSIYVLELEDTRPTPGAVGRCLDAIRADIIDSSAPPIVLRYWGRHYSTTVPRLTTLEERTILHDAIMLEETAQQVAEDPLHKTFLTGDLAPLQDGSKQLLLLKSNAANATMNTAITTSDTSRTQADYETPPPILCAVERQLRNRTHLAVPDVRV
ncbi:unnamed protein product [Peronospora belbahrii]|uniref:Stress-response A/B barrel domain-containing protein n=1 Tax=Peronospora belbahrii TaxID=622444 RepID=A0ABN8CQC1_9STRA|nr:unnamed protein product [Peronospora belbahrii]